MDCRSPLSFRIADKALFLPIYHTAPVWADTLYRKSILDLSKNQ